MDSKKSLGLVGVLSVAALVAAVWLVVPSAAVLRALLAHPDFRADKVHTRFIDEHAGELIEAAAKMSSGGLPA